MLSRLERMRSLSINKQFASGCVFELQRAPKCDRGHILFLELKRFVE